MSEGLSVGSRIIGADMYYYPELNNRILSVIDIRDKFLVSCEDIYLLFKDKQFKEITLGDSCSFYACKSKSLAEQVVRKLKTFAYR